jgi:hypothetical protein
MISKNRKYFNIAGMFIVALWVIMVMLLIKKTDYSGERSALEFNNDSIAIESPQREWKEIFIKEKKVGYSVSLIKPFKDGYYIQEDIFLKLNLMGLDKGLYSVTQSRVDKNFILNSFYFQMTSGIVNYTISGRVEGDSLLISSGKKNDQRTHVIKLSKPPMIGAGMGHYLKTVPLKVGESYALPFFDPSTMSQNETIVRVVSEEPLVINKMRYNSLRLEADMWGRKLTFWLDEDGSTLKEEGFMGLTTYKSSAANAPLYIEGNEYADFYDMTSVKIDRDLGNVESMGFIKLRISGINSEILDKWDLDGGAQKFSNGIMEVTRQRQPIKASYTIPFGPAEFNMNGYLNPEFNIESDSEEIMSKAREITKGTDDPLIASGRLKTWVFENVKKLPVLSVPSALEVLRTKAGDCNEHATLLTALLRASGIPARISVGLVYARNGFFYHAWTEAFVGEWVSMDATLDQMPVDVGHIRILYGNLERQVEIAGLVGNLEFEILDYGNDKIN